MKTILFCGFLLVPCLSYALMPAENTFPSMGKQFQEILGAQAEALNALDAQPITNGKKPWRLGGMVAGLELKASGLFSVAKIEGTENVQVQWYKQSEGASIIGSYEPPTAKAAVSLKGLPHLTVADVAAQAEPAVESVISTGKIAKLGVPLFRNNVKKVLESFLNICRSLAKIPSAPGWKADGFILEVSFEGSGEISPSMSAGGNVTLRFDWEQDEKSIQQLASESPTALDLKLQKFVTTMSKDLNYGSSKARLPGTDLDLEEIKVSLGISAGGEVGVAEVSGGVTATLAYHRSGELGVLTNDLLALDGGTMPLFQRAAGVSKGLFPKLNLIQVSRDPFRRGIDRAIKLSSNMTRYAIKASKGKWKVVEVATEFNLALSGDLGLASVKGTRGIEFIFTIPKWHTL